MGRSSGASATPTTGVPDSRFPELPLPIRPPFPVMEAARAVRLPDGQDWQYEPKWDGFRCLVFRAGDTVALQSKAGQPLSRYFPELVEAIRGGRHGSFILDGEIVIFKDGHVSFDDLLLRIHPARSRIEKLSKEAPAAFIAFDLLYASDATPRELVDRPLAERRARLEDFLRRGRGNASIYLSPATGDRDTAGRWFRELGRFGLDGVMAKKIHEGYHSGDRTAMVKVKHLNTADCVVGGFRYAAATSKKTFRHGEIGSLLLGLYDAEGLLDFVGFTSSFTREERARLREVVEPHKGGVGFTGRSPGGPNRWTRRDNNEWERLDPVLVCEVEYDYFTQHRFRHGTKFLRWRPDKDGRQCTFDQVETEGTGHERGGRTGRPSTDGPRIQDFLS
jgi:ATP-dependent DNA ligase